MSDLRERNKQREELREFVRLHLTMLGLAVEDNSSSFGPRVAIFGRRPDIKGYAAVGVEWEGYLHKKIRIYYAFNIRGYEASMNRFVRYGDHKGIVDLVDWVLEVDDLNLNGLDYLERGKGYEQFQRQMGLQHRMREICERVKEYETP